MSRMSIPQKCDAVPGKERKRLEELRRISTAIAVYGTATIIHADGSTSERVVRLWDSPPRWWNQSQEDQRCAWVNALFTRQLGLKPDEPLLSVTIGEPRT